MSFMGSLITFLCLQTLSRGQDFTHFADYHKEAMEAHIMAGYGGGWEECDLLAIPPLGEYVLGHDTPKFVLDMAQLRAVDIRTSFSKSHCLLIKAYVGSPKDLAGAIAFGWTAVHHKRLGMALKLGSNLTLGMAANITNLPFPIAAQSVGGEEQFLIPSFGEEMPELRPNLVHHRPNPSYSGKQIRICLYEGKVPSTFFKGGSKQLGPVAQLGIRLMSMLGGKMKLKINYVTPAGTGINLVICT